MVLANVPFLNIIGNPDIRDGLDMIGVLQGFRPFWVGGDDDKKGGDNKKRGNDDGGKKCQKVS